MFPIRYNVKLICFQNKMIFMEKELTHQVKICLTYKIAQRWLVTSNIKSGPPPSLPHHSEHHDRLVSTNQKQMQIK